MTVYVVESIAFDAAGKPAGTFRVYTPHEARAREIAAAAPGRSWRAVEEDKIPGVVRKRIEEGAAKP